MLRTSLLALAVCLAAVLCAAAGAQAAVYCVGTPSDCTGISKPGTAAGLQEALSAAESSAEGDTVRIGAGTYSAPGPAGFAVNSPAHPIVVRGESTGATVLQGSGADASTLSVVGTAGDSSGVGALTVKLSAGGGSPTGLRLTDAGGEMLAVESPSGLASGVGVRLAGLAELSASTVATAGLTGVESVGHNGISLSSITAGAGVLSSGPSVTIVGTRIRADRLGVAAAPAALLINCVIHMSDGPTSETALAVSGTAQADHLTVVGTGAPARGVLASKAGGGTTSLSLANSTVTGFDADLSAAGDALSLAAINVSYSNYASEVELTGGAINPGLGVLNVAPGFADPAGDFHLRHDSPLLDAGDPQGTVTEGDLDMSPRVVAGMPAGLPRRDVGAYEYQAAAPTAALDGPALGNVGEPLRFAGTPSHDPDPADALSYAWNFGDGATAAGEIAEHAYSAPGTYVVTLEVTDPTEQTGTTTESVAVVVPPPAGPAGTGGATVPSGDAAADTQAPLLSGLVVSPRRIRKGAGASRRRGTVRFTLSEPARVTFRFARYSPAKRRWIRLRGRIAVDARDGQGSAHLGGRVSRWRAGRYRVTGTARDAVGNRATPRTARFILLPKRG